MLKAIAIAVSLSVIGCGQDADAPSTCEDEQERLFVVKLGTSMTELTGAPVEIAFDTVVTDKAGMWHQTGHYAVAPADGSYDIDWRVKLRMTAGSQDCGNVYGIILRGSSSVLVGHEWQPGLATPSSPDWQVTGKESAVSLLAGDKISVVFRSLRLDPSARWQVVADSCFTRLSVAPTAEPVLSRGSR